MTLFKTSIRIFVLLPVFGFLVGCGSSHMIVAYKNPNRPRQEYNRIIVAGMINDSNDTLKRQVEKTLADELKGLGYNAVPASEEFGIVDIGDRNQAETYRRLCGKGIDAVITIALIDKSKETVLRSRKSYGYPNNYYYDRVWNYKNILADIPAADLQSKTGYFWECILFDLLTLEAVCTIQTSSFKNVEEKRISRDFEKKIIRKMLKEKILVKDHAGSDLKAF